MIPLELEDRHYLSRLPELPSDFRTYSRPDHIDVEWHKTENQGRIGSCQGNGLTSVLERLQFVRYNDKSKVVQLSRIFAYLATQKIDGLLGRDSGSTISGGIKLATTVGCCPEALTGYPQAYPHSQQIKSILSAANYAAGEPFKAEKTWRAPEDAEEVMSFIAGGGAVSIGIAWYSGLIPRDRIVRRFSPPGRSGGHAMAILGYKSNGNLIGVNSHADGPYEIEPSAWRSMIRHRYTAAIGLSCDIKPRHVDWEKELVFTPPVFIPHSSFGQDDDQTLWSATIPPEAILLPEPPFTDPFYPPEEYGNSHA